MEGLLDLLVNLQEIWAAVIGAIVSTLLATWLSRKRPQPTSQLRRGARLRRLLTSLPRAAVLGVPLAILVAFLAVWLLQPVSTDASLGFPEPECHPGGDRGLLLFLHGWKGDPQDTWQSFPELACEDDRLQGVEVLSVGYPTFMARRNLTIAELASWLDQSLASRYAGDARSIFIIAHSMGGLIARELAIGQSLGGAGSRVAMIVALASPFDGARPARLAAALGISSRLTKDMSQGSSYLTRLRVQWLGLSPRPWNPCFYSQGDEVVRDVSAGLDCDEVGPYLEGGHKDLAKPRSMLDEYYDRPISQLVKRLGELEDPDEEPLEEEREEQPEEVEESGPPRVEKAPEPRGLRLLAVSGNHTVEPRIEANPFSITAEPLRLRLLTAYCRNRPCSTPLRGDPDGFIEQITNADAIGLAGWMDARIPNPFEWANAYHAQRIALSSDTEIVFYPKSDGDPSLGPYLGTVQLDPRRLEPRSGSGNYRFSPDLLFYRKPPELVPLVRGRMRLAVDGTETKVIAIPGD